MAWHSACHLSHRFFPVVRPFFTYSVVWEKLDQIDGDTEYVDCDFIRSSRCSLVNAEDPPNQQE